MKLKKSSATVLLIMGGVMLFFWITRSITWYTNDLQNQEGYLPFVHLPIIVISLTIGFYLVYLGIKGRRAARREARNSSQASGATS
ncbi:MAG: hypothetical protein ACR2KW_08415 [Rubrobacter sp.]